MGTVKIGDKFYDNITGLPVDGVDSGSADLSDQNLDLSKGDSIAEKFRENPAEKNPSYQRATRQPVDHRRHNAHTETLNRKFVKKPSSRVRPVRAQRRAPKISTSPLVSHFASTVKIGQSAAAASGRAANPAAQNLNKISAHAAKFSQTTPETDAPFRAFIAPAAADRLKHPAAKAKSFRQKSQPTNHNSQKRAIAGKALQRENSRALKNALIREQLAAPAALKKPLKSKRKLHFSTVASLAAALILVSGYFAYINMPNLSVRVAAVRAGVSARAPGYVPSGYQINGNVAYQPGSVTINYKANGNDWHYSLTQATSQWDSAALLSSQVAPADQNYQTLQRNGLTIYRYNDSAAWVNGGVLYTLDGNANLSDDQVLKIAGGV
ncbi:MAG: DUF4367 domain-containing protein [Candidatus Nomurabacteria bacterium]|jgi:hypothetical protein|nr:DUF4367 domain-containing protein [Candidatus Nomurabacteria bacterium]